MVVFASEGTTNSNSRKQPLLPAVFSKKCYKMSTLHNFMHSDCLSIYVSILRISPQDMDAWRIPLMSQYSIKLYLDCHVGYKYPPKRCKHQMLQSQLIRQREATPQPPLQLQGSFPLSNGEGNQQQAGGSGYRGSFDCSNSSDSYSTSCHICNCPPLTSP